MPHKHKRKHPSSASTSATISNGTITDDFDLPPTKRARPLGVHRLRPESWEGFGAAENPSNAKPNKRRKPSKTSTDAVKAKDDTPKNFARLMAWTTEGRKLRKGLDDGVIPAKERKGKDGKRKEVRQQQQQRRQSVPGATTNAKRNGNPNEAPQTTNNDQTTISEPTERAADNEAQSRASLRIQPGETLSTFALRVDQNLPLSSIPKHSTKASIPGLSLKQKLTKHNRNLQRMQTEWRNAETKIRARKEEENEEEQDRREEEGLLWLDVDAGKGTVKGKKKQAREKGEGDIWAVVGREGGRKGNGQAGVVGKGLRASEMVQGPPVLKAVKNIFRDGGGNKGTTRPLVKV